GEARSGAAGRTGLSRGARQGAGSGSASPPPRVRLRSHQSPSSSRIGAAMKTEELVATTTPNAIGIAKLATALPPQTAIGRIARKVLSDVKMQRASTWLMLRSISSRNGITL